ncbi:MAG: cellulase family glycosylhydrolase [Promethearchaeota archaeon]
MTLKLKNKWFIDGTGRSVLLRGVNLGGSSKVPVIPNGATNIKTDFSDHENVSFVGRPFPLKEADEHFSRLKHWGFNCLRFLVTWEAIEHEGPKKYDKEYLNYIEEILKIAEEYGFYTFIDPHQDVWSRMTGGDGAPGWIFEKVGLDFTKFDETEAALVMQYRYDPNDPNTYPAMHWPSNSIKFANGTMWTLFFGGKDFAPSCKINGKNIQDYLQGHYFGAIKEIATRVKEYPNVIGFDSLNEPNQGWIEQTVDGSGTEGLLENLGYAFTPIDAMLTGAGFSRTVGFREIKGFGIKETRRDELNRNKISCWLEGVEDIWKKEGVWGLDDDNKPNVLKNEHFTVKDGKKVDFYRDYLSPFIKKYAEAVRSVLPDVIIFFEGPAEKAMKGEELNFILPENVVNATHWYDVATLGTKRPMLKANFDILTGKPVIGKKKVQKMFTRQLGVINNYFKGNFPTLIGEFGLPCDLNKKAAFNKFKKEPEKAWDVNIKALSMYYNALDANLLHSALWNYTADNSNEWGDLWNLEDLSIFSRDQQLDPNDINSGGRAIKGFCRPHFVHCAGIPLKMEFNIKNHVFYFEFDGKSSIKAPTILYVPKIQFPNGYEIKISDGEIDIKEEEQLIYLKIKEDGVYSINITQKN